jgi:hypothetical protein
MSSSGVDAEAPLLLSEANTASSDAPSYGTAAGGGSRGPPPTLPRVPSRMRRGPTAPGLRHETYSTQSELPPDANLIRNRVRYAKARTAQSYNTDANTDASGDEDGLQAGDEPDMDDMFAGDSYHTVDFEVRGYRAPSCMPA